MAKKKKLTKALYGYADDQDQNQLPSSATPAAINTTTTKSPMNKFLDKGLNFLRSQVDMNPTDKASTTLQAKFDANKELGEGFTGPNALGSIMLGAARTAGQALSTGYNAVLQGLPDLIPDNTNKRYSRPYNPLGYNPNAMGTGSQSVMDYGGYIPEARGGFRADDTNMQMYQSHYDQSPQQQQPYQLNPLPPINIQNPSREVTYEQLNTPHGKATYVPRFGGDWSKTDISRYMGNIPSTFNNLPVLRGDAYQEYNAGQSNPYYRPYSDYSYGEMYQGGGLSRDEDRGSDSHPYPSVKSSDFAGGGRSYPIPTRCLHGDTKISLLTGEEVPIRDLVGKEVWVYSYDLQKDCIVPAKATDIHLSIENTELFKVTLDNGEEILCTGNHPFLDRSGNYILAENLKEGQSLMPLYKDLEKMGQTKDEENNNNLYEYVYQPYYGFWEATHKMSWRGFNRQHVPNKFHIHHIDGNKFNNCPDNLACVDQYKHARIHGETRGQVGNKDLLTARWASDNARTEAAIRMKNENQLRHKSGQMKEIGKKISDSKKEWHWEKIKYDVEKYYNLYLEGKTLAELAKLWGVSEGKVVKARFIRAGYSLDKANLYNHKVVSIEKIDEKADVYDLTVDKYHNFAISSGVFVHNSDAVDALRLAGLHGRGDVKAKVYSKYPELKKAQNGDVINPTYDWQSKMLMEKNKNLNFVQRAYNPVQKIPDPQNPQDSMTHYMAYDDKTNRVYPTVVQPNMAQLKLMNPDQAYDYADKTGEYITAPTKELADYMSNAGYKRATSPKFGKGYVRYPGQMYEMGGMMNPDYNAEMENGGCMECGGSMEEGGYLNQYPDGGDIRYGNNPISSTYEKMFWSPQEMQEAQKQQNWVDNWYSNRRTFPSNSQKYGYDFSRGIQPGDIPEPTNRPIYTKKALAPNVGGKYVPADNEITMQKLQGPGIFNPSSSYAHEYDHYRQSLMKNQGTRGTAPYSDYIQNVEGSNFGKVMNKITTNKQYMLDPEEIHSKIMELRYLNNFQPGQRIGDNDLKNLNYGNNSTLKFFMNNLKQHGDEKFNLKDLLNQTVMNEPQEMMPGDEGDVMYSEYGGDVEYDEMKSGGKVKKNWIKGAVNPKHKGYCTPMTKSTCTPRRKAFARTMKKHHGFHKKADGGPVDGNWFDNDYDLGFKYQDGGDIEVPVPTNPDEEAQAPVEGGVSTEQVAPPTPTNSDHLTFSQAFAAARRDPDKPKVFSWRGKSYTTRLASGNAHPQTGAPISRKVQQAPTPAPQQAQAPSPFRRPMNVPTDVTQRASTMPTGINMDFMRGNVPGGQDVHQRVQAPRAPDSGVVIDKRTGKAYVTQGGKAVKEFPVLTGKNVEGESNPLLAYKPGYKPTAKEMEKNKNRVVVPAFDEATSKKFGQYKATPTGYYSGTYNQDIYGAPGIDLNPIEAQGVPAPNVHDLAMHSTYDPAVRNKLYGTKNPYVSWGCVNCHKPDIVNLAKQFQVHPDTVMVVDSKRPDHQQIIQDITRKENGGSIGNVGDEVDLTPEQIAYYKKMGYEFE